MISIFIINWDNNNGNDYTMLIASEEITEKVEKMFEDSHKRALSSDQRKILSDWQKKLNIDDDTANKIIEDERESFEDFFEDELSDSELFDFETSMKVFFNEGNAKQALNLITPIIERHGCLYDELSILELGALISSDRKKAKEIIESRLNSKNTYKI